jgi:hypothetical protein
MPPVHIPFEAHGRCVVALICLKGQQKRAYHYSKTIGEEDSWALRDYLTETILRSADSGKTASQVEGMVTYADPAQYRAVGFIPNWKRDCKDTSDRHFGSANVNTTSPNSGTLGTWRGMNRRGS